MRLFSCIGAAWFELTLSTTCRNPNSIGREMISSSPEPVDISIENVSCFNAYIQMNTLNKVSQKIIKIYVTLRDLQVT